MTKDPMAMMSRKAKYALAACLHLARHHQRGPRLIADIAEVEQLPKKFLELILLELKNAGLLASKKGKGGGYVLGRSPDDIMVGTIVRAIDGPLAPLRCASQTAPMPCDDCPDPAHCGIRAIMRDTRDAIAEILDNTSLTEVNRRADDLKETKGQDTMFYI